MMYASDLRSIARNALRGRWTVAVAAGLITSLLGGISTNSPKLEFRVQNNDLDIGLSIANQPYYFDQIEITPELRSVLAGIAVFIILAGLLLAAVFLVVGSVVGVGYSQFNLDLVDRKQQPELGTLFAYFRHWKTILAANLLQTLYVLLWSLLLVIPGIMAGYSYAMTNYILAENPCLTASEAIAQSKYLMQGNRWRLFCLEISFIGWQLLTVFTLGIGNLWLTPYTQAARAAFYRDIYSRPSQSQPSYPTF